MKRALRAIRENVGFVFGLVGFLWWLGVTPETFGQTVFDVGYRLLPFVMLASGVAIGWELNDKIAEKRAEPRFKIEGFSDYQLKMMLKMFDEPWSVKTEDGSKEMMSMFQLSRCGLIEYGNGPGVPYTWNLEPEGREWVSANANKIRKRIEE